MALEDIAQESIPVDLDKRRNLKLLNRGYRILSMEYGSIREAIEALQSVTPHKDVDGVDVHISQDARMFDILATWIWASLVWEDKTLTKEDVVSIVDEMSFFDFVRLRTRLWLAFSQSMPNSKRRSDKDPPNPID